MTDPTTTTASARFTAPTPEDEATLLEIAQRVGYAWVRNRIDTWAGDPLPCSWPHDSQAQDERLRRLLTEAERREPGGAP